MDGGIDSLVHAGGKMARSGISVSSGALGVSLGMMAGQSGSIPPLVPALLIALCGILIALWLRRREYVYYSVLCNLLTNPAMNLVFLIIIWYVGASRCLEVLIALEITVVLIEAWVMKLLCGFRPAKAMLVACLMNAGSLLAGILINDAV